MPDRQRVYRTEAIVLRRSDFGEADRLLTIYTPNLGKVRLLAKGARKPSSRKTGHLDLFMRSQLLIARGRNLDIITQAETIEPYVELRSSLERLGCAHYVAELIDSFGEEASENRELYQLLCETLSWICASSDPTMALRFFELRLLDLAGYRPQLFQCARCQRTLQPIVNLYSSDAGGALCPRCGQQEPHAVPMALGTFKVLRYLQTRDYAQCAGLKVTAKTGSDVERLLQGNLSYILERRLKSVEFLNLLHNTQTRLPPDAPAA